MHEIGEVAAWARAFAGEALHRVGALVVDDAAMPGAHQPPHDVAAHPAKADHPELHDALLTLAVGLCPIPPHHQPTVSNSSRRVSSTRLEASKISSETRLPSLS